MPPKKGKTTSSTPSSMERDSFELLFKNHPIPMWIYDLKTLAFLDVNKAAVKKYGYSRRQFLRMNLKDIRPAEDVPHLMEDVRKKRQPFQSSGPWRHQLKNGKIIDVEITSHILEIEGRRCALALAQDVTKRRQMQEVLHESHLLFQQVWESTSDAMAISDPQGIVLAANPAYFELYGHEPKHVIGGSFANIFTEENRIWAVEQYKLAFSGETAPASFESIVRRADGSTRSVESRVAFLTSGGERTAMLWTIRDITEQKQAQDALQQSEQLFKNAFQHSAIGMALVSPQGQWLKVNSRICSILGYSEDELLTTTFQDITHPDDLDADLEYVRQMLAGEIETYTMEKRYIHKNGGIVWALLAVALTKDNNGIPLYFISQVEDITERKQMENELLKSEQRYRTLFDNAPAAIFEEDFSEVKKHIDTLKQQGVTDFRAYFNSHPEAVRECAGMIRVLDVNQTALKMYHAESREALLESMLVQSKGEQEHNQDDFIAIAEGRTSNSWEGADETLTGEHLEINLNWLVTEGHEHDFSRVIVTNMDITERKQMEGALRQSEAHLEEAQRIAHVGSWDWISATDTPRWSKELCRILEVDPHKPAPTMTEQDKMYTPDSMVRMRTSAEKTMQTGEPYEIELERVREDGSSRWLLARGERWLDEHGELLGLRGTALDITERKRVEQALRESEEKLQNIIRHSSSLFYTHTVDNVLVYVSQQAREILDCEPEEAMVHWQGFLSDNPSNQQGIESTERAIRTGERQPPYQLELVTRKGRRIWVQVDESPMVRDGKTVAIVGSLTDITERRQAEEKLRESEERYKSISEDMPAMVCRFKADGTLTFINSFYCEYFELPRDELLGKNLFSFIPETEQELVRGKFLSLNREKPHISYEYRTTDRRGGECWQRWTDRALFNEQGEIFEYQSIGEDVTQRKQAEKMLQESEQRYLSLFEDSPIPLMEEDFSQVKLILDELKQAGVTDFEGYFAEHPETLAECASLVKILDVNKASLSLFGVKNKEDLQINLSALFGEAVSPSFQKELVCIAQGFLSFEWEGINKKLNGGLINVALTWSAVPGHEEDLARVIISIVDITERTQAEQEKQRLIRDLGERVKEVSFLHNVARIFMDYSRPEEEVLQDVVNNLPSAWQYPEITRARIKFNDCEFATEGFRETPWMQSRFFDISDGKRGSIEVACLEERPREEDGPFVKEEGRLLESLAEKLQTYLWGIQADRAISRQVAELETLYESGIAISRLHTPKQVAQAVIEILGRRMNWHHIAIREYEPRFNSVNLIGFHKPGVSVEEAEDHIQEMNGIITNSHQGLSGWVTLNGTSLRVPNVKTDERYVDVFTNILSGLYVPLKVGERVIGSISVESEVENAFTEDDERLLETLAGQAAIAIENANLLTTLQAELVERRLIEAEVRQLNTELEERVRERTLQTETAKRRLELAAHAGQIGVWDYYPAENKVIWDDRMHMIHHIPVGKFEGTPQAWEKFIIPDDLEKADVNKQLAVTQGLLLNREYRILLPNGTVRDISSSAVTVFSDDGEPERVVGINMDITDRKQIEQALSASEAYARLLFDAAPDPISVTEVDGTMVDVNRSFEQQHQLKHDEIRGRRLSELGIFPAGEFARLQDYNRAILKGENIPSVELTFHAPGDGRHVLEMHSYPIKVGGRQLVLSASRDISTHKKAEEALRYANSEMENALRIKDEFLANMSHELRTPLNSIIGISESLEEQLVGGLNEKQGKYVRIIKESGHHLLELINDILDISKIEAGRMELDLRAFSVEKLCQSSIRMVRELAQKKSLDISFEVKGNVKIISGDERRLKQSLVNLLSNAVKFTGNGKRIGLEVEGHPHRHEVTLTVWDEGIGIAQEHLKLLFKPFIQLDAGLTREYQGTGLGLALVAQIVRLHGGHIRVESELGIGSRFIITLPWRAEEQNAETKVTGELVPPRPMSTEKRGGRILIIEDTEIIITLLNEFLTHKGYQVFIARNGRDGIQLAKNERPDLILMDIMMPMMDGLEAAKLLREDNDFKQVPIIALTALAMPGDRERCLATGMTDYMSKPIRIDELGKMIERHLSPGGQANAEQNTDRG